MDLLTRFRLRRIAGYLEPGDAALVTTLLAAQRAHDVTGAIAEIGVHHGKLALLMGVHLQRGERLVAVDLFAEQQENSDRSGKGDLATFRRHARRLGLGERIAILQTNSTRVSLAALRDTAGAPCRMFSVDGGHGYATVTSDMTLAAGSLCPGGIIVADDYFNYGWPDVSAAVADFVRRSGAIIPFAVSSSKLYLTNAPAWAERYRAALRAGRWPVEKDQRMAAHPVLVFDTRSIGSTLFTLARIARRATRAATAGRTRAADRRAAS